MTVQLHKTVYNLLKFHLLLWRISLSLCYSHLGEETQETVSGPKAWWLHKPISSLPVLFLTLQESCWTINHDLPGLKKMKGKERKGKEIIRLVLSNWKKSSIHCFVLYPPRVTLNNSWVKWDFLTLNMQKDKISCKHSAWMGFEEQNKGWINWLISLSWLPRWLSGKKSACQCRRHEFHSWVEKIPCRNKEKLTLVLPEKSHGLSSRQTMVQGVAKSQTRLSNWACTSLNLKTHSFIQEKVTQFQLMC